MPSPKFPEADFLMPFLILKDVSSLNNALVEVVLPFELNVALGDPTSLMAGDIDIEELELSEGSC